MCFLPCLRWHQRGFNDAPRVLSSLSLEHMTKSNFKNDGLKFPFQPAS